MNSPDIRLSSTPAARVRNTSPNRSILLSATILRDISDGTSNNNNNSTINNEDMNIFTNMLDNSNEKDINLISAQTLLHSQLINSLRNSLLKEIDDTQWMFTAYDGENIKRN